MSYKERLSEHSFPAMAERTPRASKIARFVNVSMAQSCNYVRPSAGARTTDLRRGSKREGG
jgi:hypothetical protein